MNTLDTAGAAILLAHDGSKQLAAALAVHAGNAQRAAFAWLRDIVASVARP